MTQGSGFTLKRPAPRRSLISVVSMIDVMMILLFFFMVTSTYLNLDMVPALERSDETPAPEGSAAAPGASSTLLIRIAADGAPTVGGQALDQATLETLLRDRLAADPLTPIVLFPSGGAHLQDLIRLMDSVTRAGAQRVKVIRVEAAQ